MKIIFILVTIAITFSVSSSEVDSFHHRYESHIDATENINQHSNILFDNVLDLTNKSIKHCSEELLYKNLHAEFHNHFGGNFNKYISNSEDLDRVTISTSDSIYGNFSLRDSILLRFISQDIIDFLASGLNIRGHFIGTDKFEHFAGSGFIYFENYYLKNKSLESTLAIGTKDEKGIMGSYSTGVISYGDMSAEFNGMRFWNHILAKNPDVLGINLGPYVKCENNQWAKVKEIDFSQYVDDAWDEGINCSDFRTDDMLNKIKNNINKMEEITGQRYTCPIVPMSPQTLNKYGPYTKILINDHWKKAQ